jgi:hypothetical protein
MNPAAWDIHRSQFRIPPPSHVTNPNNQICFEVTGMKRRLILLTLLVLLSQQRRKAHR